MFAVMLVSAFLAGSGETTVAGSGETTVAGSGETTVAGSANTTVSGVTAPKPKATFAPTTGAPRATICVLASKGSVSPEFRWLGPAVTESLTSRLLEAEVVNVVGVRQTAKAAAADNIANGALNEPAAVEHLARQTGADYCVAGSFAAWWPKLTVVAHVYSLKDRKFGPSIFVSGFIDQFFSLEQELSSQIFAQIPALAATKPLPSAAVIGTKNLYALHAVVQGYEALAAQSLSPRSRVTLRTDAQETARLHFEQALRLDPSYGDAYAGLGQVLAFARFDKAATANFEQAKKQATNGFSAHVALGEYYWQMRSGRSDAALQTLRTAVKARPGFLLAQGYLAEAYNHLGRHREALQVYEAYRDLCPKQAWVLAQLGYTSAKLKRYPESIQYTEAAIALLPESLSFQTELASRYIDADNLDQAAEVLGSLLNRSPSPLGGAAAKIKVRLGYVRLLQNQNDAAISLLEQALKDAADANDSRTVAYAHFDLARAWATKKDNKVALDHLRQAVAAGFSDIDAIETAADFEPLRNDGDFAGLIQRAAANKIL